MHQDFIFDTSGGIGRQPDVLFHPVGADGLDQSDGADGDQILQVHAGIFKPPGNVYHQPEVSFNEQLLCLRFSPFQRFQRLLLLHPLQRWGEHIAAAYVKYRLL